MVCAPVLSFWFKKMNAFKSCMVASVLLAAGAKADNWGNWRGPNHDGSTNESNLPVKFSKTGNIAWSATLPGPSAATPVVWGDHVFVSSSEPGKERLLAICLDRKTGAVKWQHQASKGNRQDDRSNYAAPSPVTDGKVVAFFYGNGDLVTYDLDGKKLWSRNIQDDYGQFAFLWTFSTSPLIHEDVLYMQVLQRDTPVRGRGREEHNDSYLLALDPRTGRELWRRVRPSEAHAESLEAFSTPIPFSHDGRDEILIAGGDCLTGHDPRTGNELWRWGTWNPTRIGHWRLVPSPVAGGGVVLACAPKGSPVYAVKAGRAGNISENGLAWKSGGSRGAEKDGITSDVATPLFYKEQFFILYGDGRNKLLTCIEPGTGKKAWSTQLESRSLFRASPTGSDGKIYLMNHAGMVYVVQAASGKVLHQADMGEAGDDHTRASVAIAQGGLFIRTNSRLYHVASN